MSNALIDKVRRKLWSKLVRYLRYSTMYPLLYRSYWHYLFHKNNQGENTTAYFGARPNPGAGIGHQMANWIAGYWWSKQFGLKFAHLPFSTGTWEGFLGFGEQEIEVEDLVKKGYKKIKLPLFEERKSNEVKLVRQIISSYTEQEVVFVCEQDQFYRDQYGVVADIQKKFYSASARKNNTFTFDQKHFNIAIHVRRGDIMADPNNPNLQMRYLANDYFEKVLRQVLETIQTDKPKHIYFFSQGNPNDYPEFKQFDNLHWCLDMGAQDSFLHMVYADVLITSKSSFSYKPALLNRNIKVCPKNFWHGYPNTKDWVMVDNRGELKRKTS
ncbi:Glycosyl transferase family 11 [Zobellia roscoffensis]|uniref:hypothetical protein n=1 Tax=Zobellia roscoffensis TaxID=2779508 RepID=UPI00188D44C0|nr:hypothetical protein [Zobellia roscoffensis]